ARETRDSPSRQAAMRQPDALRSAGFAPRADNAPRIRPVERGNTVMPGPNAYRTDNYRAESAGMPNRYRPIDNGYRQPARAPRIESAPRAMPQYRAEAPRAEPQRAAPRAQQAPAGGHGRGRGRNDHQD
ncbi:MAG TPA: hypothetical protein VFM52_08955, partial [Rhodanobacter sp.]|nr:hypothetical protein [Rhodanobacter sp.]